MALCLSIIFLDACFVDSGSMVYSCVLVFFVAEADRRWEGGRGTKAGVRKNVWNELEAHPIENNDCERDLALICYLGQNAPVLRLEAKAGIARFGRNAGRAGQQLVIDKWTAAQQQSAIRYSMQAARAMRIPRCASN